jgi:hypothetical protein
LKKEVEKHGLDVSKPEVEFEGRKRRPLEQRCRDEGSREDRAGERQ